ncbi:MAG: hypothetical protein AB9882_05045 [Ignavibacteriaceae bacterium]
MKTQKSSKNPTKTENYFRIYDDNEEKNYFKTVLTRKRVEKLIKDFEKKNERYINSEFITYLKKYDADAEMIKIETISY